MLVVGFEGLAWDKFHVLTMLLQAVQGDGRNPALARQQQLLFFEQWPVGHRTGSDFDCLVSACQEN